MRLESHWQRLRAAGAYRPEPSQTRCSQTPRADLKSERKTASMEVRGRGQGPHSNLAASTCRELRG
eukprot:8541552-Pyramimonas_sp.AAC.1